MVVVGVGCGLWGALPNVQLDLCIFFEIQTKQQDSRTPKMALLFNVNLFARPNVFFFFLKLTPESL